MHAIVDAGGERIASGGVTRGTAHDSPRFRQMFAMVPDGTGCMVLDAGYDAIKNYKMIRDAGRKPVICTRKNHVARGLHVVGANFSSVGPRITVCSAHLRSQAGLFPACVESQIACGTTFV